jgi:hypothetical protein
MSSALSHLTDDLGNAAPFVIVAGGLIGVWHACVAWYRCGPGSRRDLAKRLNQLAAGVTLQYVEERFGTPAFVRAVTPAAAPPNVPASPSRTQPVRALLHTLGEFQRVESEAPSVLSQRIVRAPDRPAPGRPVRELIYHEKHGWVQVLVDADDAVARFSITVTDPKFRFSTALLTWGHLQVKLGRSHFSDLPIERFSAEGRSLRIGAHNHEYAESYWFGNPGQYQRFVLSANELGTGDFGYSIEREGGPGYFRTGMLAHEYQPLAGQQPEFDAAAPYALHFRAATTINTLTVLGPAGRPEDLMEPRGPNSNHVRVLVPNRRERREIKRRARQANMQLRRTQRVEPDEPDDNSLLASPAHEVDPAAPS